MLEYVCVSTSVYLNKCVLGIVCVIHLLTKLQILYDEESEQGGEKFSHCCKLNMPENIPEICLAFSEQIWP